MKNSSVIIVLLVALISMIRLTSATAQGNDIPIIYRTVEDLDISSKIIPMDNGGVVSDVEVIFINFLESYDLDTGDFAPNYEIWRGIGEYPDITDEPYSYTAWSSDVHPDANTDGSDWYDLHYERGVQYCYAVRAVKYNSDFVNEDGSQNYDPQDPNQTYSDLIEGASSFPEYAQCYTVPFDETVYQVNGTNTIFQLMEDGSIRYCADGVLYTGSYSEHSNSEYTYNCIFDSFSFWLIINPSGNRLIRLALDRWTGENVEISRDPISEISSFSCSGSSGISNSSDGTSYSGSTSGGCFINSF